jgi:peptidoglycan hydrolase CwlO-like protein
MLDPRKYIDFFIPRSESGRSSRRRNDDSCDMSDSIIFNSYSRLDNLERKILDLQTKIDQLNEKLEKYRHGESSPPTA